jgi:hypothetical protein
MSSLKVNQSQSSNTDIRNVITRTNVFMLIMAFTFVMQLISMILTLSNSDNIKKMSLRKNDTLNKPEDINLGDWLYLMEEAPDAMIEAMGFSSRIDGKMWGIFNILGPILIFSCMSLHVINRVLINNIMLNIISTILLLIITCLVCAYSFKLLEINDKQGRETDEQGREFMTQLSSDVRNLLVTNTMVTLVFSVLQFLDILKP